MSIVNRMYARVKVGGSVEVSYSHNFTNGIVCYSSKGSFETVVQCMKNTGAEVEVIWK